MTDADSTDSVKPSGRSVVVLADALGWEVAARREVEGDRYLALLRQVTVAADRLIQGWAEGDEGRKGDLWRGLSSAVEAASEVVYPLPTEDGADR